MNQQRFHGHRQVVNVIKKGQSTKAKGFSVKTLNTGQERTVVVVSKKVSKLAVARNKIRRRIQAALKEIRQFQQLNDIVVIAHDSELASRDYELLKGQLKQALTS